MSNNQEIAKRAAALLDRADEHRTEARQVLEPLNKARGWRGASDPLSSLMNFELPRRSDLPDLRNRRRDGLLKAAKEMDGLGVSIEAVPGPRKARSR